MTILERGPLPRNEKSARPNNITYVRLDGLIGLGMHESTHRRVAIDEELHRQPEVEMWEKPIVSDAGQMTVGPGGILIAKYVSQSTSLEVLRKEHNSPDERQRALEEIRRETARLTASLTGQTVWIELDSGEWEQVNL
ncbi:hypothetical protein A2774_05415 [Candidatus Roizmanbacteria bacterium RIFCSPHIGHO2_01_FULL_39_12c]|uniref:Uncharacterized protein n=1 Tax=Candidatus Roizmanbacteria bacterium RIFCSPHIGHO2_01_FULL_39_12c TaxID=1802031 RepID=A0A1F7GEN8_9BACT|nr:MAG: hypothetical protein A2774_05415 [Candidatus Roizmanbacteria bacterium RIFCSPHIGHO2_01_FULL_39_12c]OGK46733.1 MAG: hypothetical protein A2963_00690 [Candidatus Roizmanbacteria bacterium RIFCSPLOWO2_01_FULL_40_13]